jgi:hypothetical protein
LDARQESCRFVKLVQRCTGRSSRGMRWVSRGSVGLPGWAGRWPIPRRPVRGGWRLMSLQCCPRIVPTVSLLVGVDERYRFRFARVFSPPKLAVEYSS